MALPKITLNKIVLSGIPTVDQICTVQYKKTTDPGVYLTLTTNQVVKPDGTLAPPAVIANLDYSSQYDVKVWNNCNSVNYDEIFTTPAITCPTIVDIIGTAT